MRLHELLTEAKVKMRDTKGTRDKVLNWLGSSAKPGIEKDASIMNALVSFIATAVKKKKGSNGKFTLTDADFKKLAKNNISIDNLSKSLYKKVTGQSGGGKLNSNVKPTATKKVETPKKPKIRDKWEIQVGDSIFSKNGMEFYATVTKVSNGKVYVRYDIEGYGDESYGSADIGRFITGNSEDGYEAPSWTF